MVKADTARKTNRNRALQRERKICGMNLGFSFLQPEEKSLQPSALIKCVIAVQKAQFAKFLICPLPLVAPMLG